ncbi:uncharacterized mitochondrial protein-like protein [Tanacetum coccineum]
MKESTMKAIDIPLSSNIAPLCILTSVDQNLYLLVCIVSRYRQKPTENHLHAVKRIFRYLRGTINMDLWSLKDSCVSLIAFVDADHAGCQDTKKSTSRSMQLLGDRLLRDAKLEKDMSELKNVDHSAATIATLKSQVPMVVYDYLGSKLGDSLQKALHKHYEDLIQKHSVKPALKSSNIKTRTVNLEKGSEKSASEILKIKREQADKQRWKSLQSSP